MRNREFALSNMDLISMIHKAYPQGVKYANDVIQSAVRLEEASGTFYCGSIFTDYGPYPFLNVEELHFEKEHETSGRVIIESHFDRALFDGFIASLSISDKEFEDIMSDIDNHYREGSGLLDTCYLSVIRHVVEYLKCLSRRRERISHVFSELKNIPVGESHVFLLKEVMEPHLFRLKTKKLNRKKGKPSGKFLKVYPYPGIETAVIVSCEKYRPE